MPILECRRVRYFSPGDEAAFFAWLGTIKSIRKIEGRGDTLFLHVSSRISAARKAELNALFRRYGIDQRQLDQIHSKSP